MMTCKLPVRDLDSGETVLITRQTRQVSDKRACTDCEPKREGGKENSGVPLLFRKWKTGTGGKETKQNKRKRGKKRKKKEKDTARDCWCVLRNRGTLFRK